MIEDTQEDALTVGALIAAKDVAETVAIKLCAIKSRRRSTYLREKKKMANANVKINKISPVVPTVESYDLNVNLTPSEAKDLVDFVGCVGGTHDVRKILDKIYYAIEKAGVLAGKPSYGYLFLDKKQ